MPATDRRLPVGETCRLGKEIYERAIKGKLAPEDEGKYLVIEVLTGDFEFIGGGAPASERLEARHPDGHFFLTRVERGPDDRPRIRTPFLRGPQ